MSAVPRLFKSLVKLFLPIIILFLLALVGASIWLNRSATTKLKSPYVITPEKFAQLFSSSGATEESWQNEDQSPAQGWLLKGAPNAPAVIILHRYKTNRSWVLNMGVKLHEATDFTVLMPDLRGHGENPLITSSSLGSCETKDLQAAINFLKSLKTSDKTANLIGKEIGVYGVELGGYVAMMGASYDPNIKTLVVDSVPNSTDHLLREIVKNNAPFARNIAGDLASKTSSFFNRGCGQESDLCSIANNLQGRKILFLAGGDAPNWQESTQNLSNCFTNKSGIEVNTNLNPSGFNIINTTPEQEDFYDRLVIEFFKKSLPAAQMENKTPTQTPTQTENKVPAQTESK